MNITDIFQIPLFRNFTQKMQEDFLENLEYTLENHPKGKTIIHQGSPCQAIHVLLEGKLNVDVVDVSGGEVRVEVIKAPGAPLLLRMFLPKRTSSPPPSRSRKMSS